MKRAYSHKTRKQHMIDFNCLKYRDLRYRLRKTITGNNSRQEVKI